jgi:hypothetical protein
MMADDGVDPYELSRDLTEQHKREKRRRLGESDDASPRQQAGRARPEMSRRQQEELRRRNQRLVAENDALARRPGSNAPSPDAAYWELKRAKISETLDRTGMPPPQQALWEELVLARHAYQAGLSAADATLWTLNAVLRFLEPPDSLLTQLGLLDHVHVVRNAFESAVAGNMGAMQRAMPPREPATKGGEPPVPATGNRRALIAAGMEGMVVGGVVQGGVSQTAAKGTVRAVFGSEGIDLTEETARQCLQRLRGIERAHAQGASLDRWGSGAKEELSLYQKLTDAARKHLARGYWPPENRTAWVRRLATGGSRMILGA